MALAELGLLPARRPTTTMLGNGQLYDFRLGYNLWYIQDQDAHPIPPDGGWHAPYLTSYSRPYYGVGELWSIEVLDDDGNFNTKLTTNLTLDQLYAMRSRYMDGAPADPADPSSPSVEPGRWRPRSITAYTAALIGGSGYSVGGLTETSGQFIFSTRFAVSWICDNWETDITQNDIRGWEIVADKEKEELDQTINDWAAMGWRPISISGYAYAYDATFEGAPPTEERVRYAAIFVKDSVAADEWQPHYALDLTREQLFEQLDDQMSKGRLPISISSWRTNNMASWPHPGGLFDVADQGISNQRWSLVCVQDKSLDGEHSVVEDVLVNWNEVFDWEVIDRPSLEHRFEVMRLSGWRPVCMAAFSWYNYGQDVLLWEGEVESSFLVIWRRHPPRYLRVFPDTTIEPDPSQPGGYTSGSADDPYISFHERMLEFLQGRRCNAGALTLTIGDTPKLSRGYTWAPEGFPTTCPGAKFRIGSASKNLVATAIMKQWQSGLGMTFDLTDNDPIETSGKPFLAGSPLNPFRWAFSPDYTVIGEITMRRLLQHTHFWQQSYAPVSSYFDDEDAGTKEGLSLARAADYLMSADWKKVKQPISRGDFLEFWTQLPDSQLYDTANVPSWWIWLSGEQKPVERAGWPPSLQLPALLDNKFRYSNFGYELLYEICGLLGGGSAESYIKQEILEPLGMSDTAVGKTQRPEHAPGETIGTPRRATYIDDLPTADSVHPTDPFAESLARAGLGDEYDESKFFMEDLETGAPAVTSVYGSGAQCGTAVIGSGGYIGSSRDLAKLMTGFRNWHVLPFPWGLVGEFGQIILLPQTVDFMLDLATAIPVEGENTETKQTLGWRAYRPDGLPSQLAPTTQLSFYAGGDIEGGSAVALRTETGASLGVVVSRQLGAQGIAERFYQTMKGFGL